MNKTETQNNLEDSINLVEGYLALQTSSGAKIRKAAKLTQKEAGRRLGIGQVTLSQYEARSRQPRYEMLIAYGQLIRNLREQVSQEAN